MFNFQLSIIMKYLDPKNDLTFKCVFGEHKHLCMSLINSMLPLQKPIVSLEYQTGELIAELPEVLRHSVVDVRCTDSDGRQFIVEMQLYFSEMFRRRVLLNASKAYVMQLKKADEFKLLQPVYALNFVNDVFEKSEAMKNEYYHYYKIVNIKDTEKQIKGLEFLFVELPKFRPQGRAEKKLHELWLRFLTEINESTQEAPEDLLENELTREAVGYMERAAYTIEQLEAYDRRKIDAMTERGLISDAMEKGEAIGLEKGEAIGLEKGEAIGLEKGRSANREETVINCHKAGLSFDIISTVTGLTVEQITEILQRNALI